MTNEEIILKSVQAHLTPAQRHEIAAAAYTPEQIAHAVEHIPDGLDELAAAQVHTFAWWKDNGKSVKRGEKALFTCPLWKYTDKPSKAQIKAAEAAGKEVQPAAHYYPTTSYMFSCLQVESNKPAPAGRFKSIDEIKAYNKMLAEQRRAARVSAPLARLCNELVLPVFLAELIQNPVPNLVIVQFLPCFPHHFLELFRVWPLWTSHAADVKCHANSGAVSRIAENAIVVRCSVHLPYLLLLSDSIYSLIIV